MRANFLRKKYPEFVYEKYDFAFKGKDLHLSFVFRAKDIVFNPKLKIKNVVKKKKTIDNLVFNLGMIEMLSYWKAFASPKIIVKAGKLDKKQEKWWHDVLIRGMGQYFYENKINFKQKDFVKIISQGENSFKKQDNVIDTADFLVLVGGGKDSAVALEIMNKLGAKNACFALNPTKNTKKMVKVLHCHEFITAERKIDEKLLELNRKGYLNGHTPFLAYLSFLSALICVLFNKKYIVLANEDSASEGNVCYLGEEINHQYSKSYDFEKKFINYLNKYISKDIGYFSILRPVYELQIAKAFSSIEKYLPVFLSCNESQKTYSGTRKKLGNWCGKCSKCLFVYTALYPFVEYKKLVSIFKKDLFKDKDLLKTMLELIGLKKVKPWECVGTRKESLVAFYLCLKKNKKEKRKNQYLLEYFDKRIASKKTLEKYEKQVMHHWNKKNSMPLKFEILVKLMFSALLS